MAFQDQDQPIDYTNRYNENIGSISPKTSANRPNHSTNAMFSSKNDADQPDSLSSYGTLSNSQFGDLQNAKNLSSTPAGFGSNFNQNYFSQQNNSCDQPKGETNFASYLFTNPDSVADSVTIYQTEDTPVSFSNISSVSSLSLERLPVIHPFPDNISLNTQPISTFKQSSIHETELNSSGDSVMHYHMESSPYCLSYESTSPLSLDLHSLDGELTPETLELFNTRIMKQDRPFDQDITSMISGMSIDRNSTRSSTERLNRKEPLKFGQLSDGDGFSLLDLDVRQVKPEKFDDLQQPAPRFLESPNSVVNHQQQQQQSQNQERNFEQVDFEQGFDEDDDDKYLNKCISFGRMASNKNALTPTGVAPQQPTLTTSNQAFVGQHAQQLISQPLHQFAPSPVTHPSPPPAQHQPEEIPYTQYREGALPFNRKELLKQREAAHNNQQARTTHEQRVSHPVVHHPTSSPKQQQQFTVQSSPSLAKKAMPSSKQFVSLDDDSDTATTISSDFSKKYGSRADYTIDGQEEKRYSSVPFAPIIDPLKYQVQYQQSQNLANQPIPMQPECQVKAKGFKKIFKTISRPFKNL